MSTILVTGASGTIGQRVVRALVAAGHQPLAMSRDPRHLAGLPPQAQRVVGDFSDPASLTAAMRTVEWLFVLCPNAPEQVEHECAVIDAAARAGVSRIVKLSARGAHPSSAVAFWRWHAAIEEHLAGVGIPFVALRPGFSMANILGHADEVREGVLPTPAAPTPVAMVHPDDVADVAAHLLTAQTITGTDPVQELTGPEAVTFADLAQRLTRLTGRSVQYLPASDEQVGDLLGGRGVPPFVVEQILAVFDALRAGAQARPTDTVTRLLGRPGRSLAAFLDEHREAFGQAGRLPHSA
ncbi:MAG: NAD(P)H-binding protein [Dermatophilaceae bacterium]